MNRVLDREFLGAVDAHMLELIEEHGGSLVAITKDAISAGGKRLRPLLVRHARPSTYTADSANFARYQRAAIRAAAAVELIHTASLVHDDLLDQAELRRGELTIGVQAGRATATAVGDLLLSLAFATLAQTRNDVGEELASKAVLELALVSQKLAEGEALQAQQQRDAELDEQAYLDRCTAKTGVLFRAALTLGALLGEAHDEDLYVLARFGELAGTAFQVADDVLDCGTLEQAEILGKQPGADLRDGTITLPMLHAIRHDETLADVLSAPISEEHVHTILDRIRATGALEHSRSRALSMRDEAVALLQQLGTRFDREPLAAIAASSVDRIS